MTMSDDVIPDKARLLADVPPPPPPPGSPLALKSPATPLMPRGPGTEGTGTSSVASNSAGVSSPDPLLSPPLLVEIEEGTPAAEALKANADVRVSKLRKVGRSTKLQAGVRVLKSAARTASGQPGHAGDRRGAPDFVAPRTSGPQGKGQVGSSSGQALASLAASAGQQPPTIPEVDDEGSSDHGLSKDALGEEASIEGDNVSTASPERDGSGPLDKSINLDDSSTERGAQQPYGSVPLTPGGNIVDSLLMPQHSTRHGSGQHVTHAALPAAIAAACKAGEDLDRKRATLIERSASDGAAELADHHKSSSLGALAHIFKSTANAAEDGQEDGSASPKHHTGRPNARVHRRSVSVPESKGVSPASHTSPHPFFRRTSMEKSHAMPSEISVAETEKHANIRGDSSKGLLDEDLSDDEGGQLDISDRVRGRVGPIVVEVPGSSRHVTVAEETKDDEEERLRAAEEGTAEAAEERRDLMAKAKKRMSRRPTSKRLKHGVDEELFHFHGPKSVRKWVNKRRSKEESKNQRSYVKGKVIDGKHELYTMSIAVMFGMRTSIGRTNLEMSKTAHNERRWLDNDDLMAVVKYEFPPRGSDITPPHQLNHTFKFKDYSPLGFAYLRRMFGVNEYDFLCSVCGNANYIEFQSNAKSGQFFFYSPDGKYMIKTMTNTESKFLRRILPHYFRHCAMNPNTLVTKFLGMYRVKLYHLRRNVKFVVMKSVYDTDKCLHQLYDVKGSTTGRDARPSDAVKKDNDIRRTLPGGAFMLEPGFRDRLRTQVENDCKWLKSMKIMDYSMLIGVHNISYRTTKTPIKSVSQPVRAFSNDDADDRSNSSYDASNATLDRFLDVDDDDSYLDGAHPKGGKARVAYDTSSTSDEAVRTVRVMKSPDNIDEESSKGSMLATDALVEKAIEDMYWPFHRFYDIQGLRRMEPIRDSLIAPETRRSNRPDPPDPKEERQTLYKELFASKSVPAGLARSVPENLPGFQRPLSYRKDGGFGMDTTGIDLPIKLSVPGAPHLAEYCDGKIFYMGIIDILQQFNIRKRLEARYRRLGGKGWEAASCVHPSIYADRFIRFFDEYTACAQAPNEISDSANSASNHSERVKRKTE